MLPIAKRNLLIFFRDKSAVFFSLLAVFIIIGLYALFLGDNLVRSVGNIDGGKTLIISWVMAGILAVTSVTTTMGAFGIMVEDRSKMLFKDFSASPMKRSGLAGGYIVSSVIIGIIMSLVTFILAEIYIVSVGGQILSITNMLKIFALLILSVLASSSMVFFIVSFFKSQNAFSTASTIVGTLIGFLTGIYLPIGLLPEAVQFFIKIFPISHAGALIRQVLLQQPMETSFANAPAEVVETFMLDMGVVYQFGDYTIGVGTSVSILIVTTILFYGLSVLNISRKSA
ncbi:ABC transporter permease [Brevibacillus daliensis]|uniref:ABC transporter permease n=1 Tax=Brevibacillus daliensis TaxID=2892995 RepID=UPI001E3D04DA|nr:ABC transporter permease [Brevibacillus daliensis]